jgi:hypothetical protein
VYGLVDPKEPDRIRYVGQSIHPDKRLAEHCGIIGPYRNPGALLATWIVSLRRRRPRMVILEHGDPRILLALEGLWIHRLQATGQADLNQSGGCLRVDTAEARLKNFTKD